MSNIQLSNPATIRAYFEKVRELHKSGVEYPVNLDDVWALCYVSKHKAVEQLKKIFTEKLHYLIFTQKGEKSGRGRPELGYRLSVSCMEFFIASRIPEVFEVYRLVFHRAADQVESQRELSRKELALMVLRAEEEKEQLLLENAALKQETEEAKPKVEFYDAVTQSDEVCDMAKVAKLLNFPGMGRNKLFDLLRTEGILRANNEPYQSYVDKGWFKVIEMKFERNDKQRVGFKTVVYQVGIEGIRNLLLKVKRRQRPDSGQSGLFNYPVA